MAHVASSRLLDSIFRQILEELTKSSDDSVVLYLYANNGGRFSTLTYLEDVFAQLGELPPTTSDKVAPPCQGSGFDQLKFKFDLISFQPTSLKRAAFRRLLYMERELLELVRNLLQTALLREILAKVARDEPEED